MQQENLGEVKEREEEQMTEKGRERERGKWSRRVRDMVNGI